MDDTTHQLRLAMPEKASEYLEALLAEQHEAGPACPQHTEVLPSSAGRCYLCDADAASQRASSPRWWENALAGVLPVKAFR